MNIETTPMIKIQADIPTSETNLPITILRKISFAKSANITDTVFF